MKNLSYLLIFLLFFAACNSNQSVNMSEKKGTDSAGNPNLKNKPSDVVVEKDGGIPIFYNMYLSVEMSSLFHSLGASYDQTILNSPDNIIRYNSSTAKALNLGVYAVDLCYAKYFDQLDQAGKSLKAMHKLSTDLGIPDDAFAASLKRVENNISNRDSLIKIANQLYASSEKYLKENDRESAAAFVIAGGWTESMFIAVILAKKYTNDSELLERIAEQKNSLHNLIDLLKKYSSETIVKDYLLKLSDLRSGLDKFEADKEHTGKQLNEISSKIVKLRKEMVE